MGRPGDERCSVFALPGVALENPGMSLTMRSMNTTTPFRYRLQGSAWRTLHRAASSLLILLMLPAHAAFAAPGAPDLQMTIGDSGNFRQGDVGDTYTLTVTNVSTKTATSGTVTMLVNNGALPAGLSATGLAATGWNCNTVSLTCTYPNAIPPNTGYQILLTVNVAGNAPGMVTVSATVSGGGDTSSGNDTASDQTPITQVAPNLSMDVFDDSTSKGAWNEGDTARSFSIRVDNSNIYHVSTDGSVVSVVASVSSGLSVTGIAGTGWTCDPLPALHCTRSDVLPNFTSYPNIIVTVNVAANAATPQSCTATVSGGGDTTPDDNFWTDNVPVVQKPDLTIHKAHTGVWNLGDTGRTYSITVSNVGGIATDGSQVKVVDSLPAGLSATDMSGAPGSGWSCTSLTCTRSDPLAAAASYPPITVTVNVANNAPANMTNTATVSGGGETNTANDTASDPTRTNQADLVLTKTHSGNWNPGDTGRTYTLKATNAGASPTDGSTVTVTDTLPAGLSATLMAGSGWNCSNLSCTRTGASAVLAAGAGFPDITLTVDVASDAQPIVTNTASVSGGGELDTTNDSASDPTTINEPDLRITMSRGTPLAQGQGFASYNIFIQNVGTMPTSGTATVVDSLPAGLTVINMLSGSGWNCTPLTLTCTYSSPIPAGGSSAIFLEVSVDRDAPASVTNTVTLTLPGEINTANNVASDTASVTQKQDLTIAKTHTGIWTQGDANRDYTITVSNIGYAPSIAATVTVTDTLPAGLTASAISGSGWSCSTPPTLTCTRADVLANGSSYPPITVTVNVAPDAAAHVVNTATVSGGGEFYTANDSASDDTAIASSTPGIDLAIQIDDGSSGSKFFEGGMSVEYTITVQNIGTLDAHGAKVQDMLPANLLGATWTCAPGPGAGCTAGSSGPINDTVNIPAGSGLTYHLSATALALPESPAHNTATVATGSGETDVNSSNNAASVTDAVGIFEGSFDGP